MAKIKIKFTRDSLAQESTEPIKAGTVLEVEEASAARWIRRGAAEEVTATKAAAKPDPKPEPKPEPKASPSGGQSGGAPKGRK